MATIVEIQNKKIECLSEYAEKLVKYSHKILECLEDIDDLSEERYLESYAKRKHDKMKDRDCDEYIRYY